MTTASLQYERKDTVMQGVHTLVAFPQWYINYNLDTLLQYGKTEDGKSLKKVELRFKDTGIIWLNGTISKIWINVHVNGCTNKVKFILSFSEGTMVYYDIKAAKQKEADIKGLQFGFDVDLSYKDLEDDKTISPEVKKQIETVLNNYDKGALTIQQLFMDFESSVLSQYDPTVTIFPETMDASAKAAFSSYLNTYLEDLKSAGGHILGYALKVDNPGSLPDPVASFPPTSLYFVTNQYKGPSSELNPDLDTINYLIMTDGKELPENLNNFWGNYIVPEDDSKGWYGTMAIAKELFVHNYLLQKLSPFVNKYLEFPGGHSLEGDLIPNKSEKEGCFKKELSGGTFQQSPPSYAHMEKDDKFHIEEAIYNFSTKTNLFFNSNKNKITIVKTSNFDLEGIYWYGPIKGKLIQHDRFRTWFEVPVTIEIEFKGIDKGKLVVDVSRSIPEDPDPTVVDADYKMPWLITHEDGDRSILSNFIAVDKSDLCNVMNDYCNLSAMNESLVDSIKKYIEDSLQLHPFVFPYGSQVFMSDPVFNNEGDLLVGLKLKR